MMRMHIGLLGLPMALTGSSIASEGTKKEWSRTTRDAMKAARAARLMALKREATREGASRGHEAYMRSVAKPEGQEGRWAALVPAFAIGTRVKFRRYRLGLIDGAAKMVARRTLKFESAKAALPAGILHCPACGGVETANHALLHCHRTQGVWDDHEAIAAATEGAKGTAAERARAALDRGRKANHLLGSADLVHGAPIAHAEVALRAGATKSLVLGFARVDGQLKVDRAPIRALAKAAAKARRLLRLLIRLPNRAAPAAAPGPAPAGMRHARPGIRSRPPGARRPRGGGRRDEWRGLVRMRYCLVAGQDLLFSAIMTLSSRLRPRCELTCMP